MHWGLSSLINIWKRKERTYYWSPWAISRRGWELKLAGEKEIKQLSEKNPPWYSLYVQIPWETGCFFNGGNIPGPSQIANYGVIWVSIAFYLSWVTFSEGSKSNWAMTVWPSALWKSMCKGCGFLFYLAKCSTGKWQNKVHIKEVKTLWKLHSSTLSPSVCGVHAVLPVFVFSNLGKNLPFSCWTTRRSDWKLSQFQAKTLGGGMLLTHKTVLPGWMARTEMCYRHNPHSSNKQKIGKIKYLPMETLTGNTSLINIEFSCKIKV